MRAERRNPAGKPQLPHPSTGATGASGDAALHVGMAADAPDSVSRPAPLPVGRGLQVEEARDATDSEPQASASEKSAQPPSVLTVDELAALLRVNRKTVYDALARGDIPGARRIGATYRILRDAVLEWLASGQDRAARSRRNR